MARDLRMQRPMPQNRRTGRIPSPSNIPEAGQYQAPGTSGIGDYGLGLLYEENPDWTSAKSSEDAAKSASDSARETLNTAKASDLEKEKTPASQKVQTGGGKAGKKGGKKGKKKN